MLTNARCIGHCLDAGAGLHAGVQRVGWGISHDDQQGIGCCLNNSGQGLLHKFAQAFAGGQAAHGQQQALISKLMALPKILQRGGALWRGGQCDPWMHDADFFGCYAQVACQLGGGLAVGNHAIHAPDGRVPHCAVSGVLHSGIQPMQIHMGMGAAGAGSQPGGRGRQAASCQHDVWLKAPRHGHSLPCGCQQKARQRAQWHFGHWYGSRALRCRAAGANQLYLRMAR